MAAEEPSSSKDNNDDKDKWFPLESNPILMNEYISRLGFDTSRYGFVDVFSTEDWALDLIPQPVVAVLVLYPLPTPKQPSCDRKNNEDAPPETTAEEKVWFIRQRIGNACGTIGLLHSLMNIPQISNDEQNTQTSSLFGDSSSWLWKFRKNCSVAMSPTDKAIVLENDPDIAGFHDEATSSDSNQTDRGNGSGALPHFVALVGVNNQLYELDGRKNGPVHHGPTSPNSLLGDASKVVQKWMQRDPSELRFSILALAPKATTPQK